MAKVILLILMDQPIVVCGKMVWDTGKVFLHKCYLMVKLLHTKEGLKMINIMVLVNIQLLLGNMKVLG